MRVLFFSFILLTFVNSIICAQADRENGKADEIEITLLGGAAAAMRFGEEDSKIASGGVAGASIYAPTPGLRRLEPFSDSNISFGFMVSFADEMKVESSHTGLDELHGNFIFTARQDTRSGYFACNLGLLKLERWLTFGILARLDAASANFLGRYVRHIGEEKDPPINNNAESVMINSNFNGQIFYPFIGIQLLTDKLHLLAEENAVQFGMELGYAARVLGGDIGQSKAAEFRRKVIGMGDTHVNGMEFGTFLLVNTTRVYFRISWLNGKSDVSGLTGLRLLVGADALADLFRYRIALEES